MTPSLKAARAELKQALDAADEAHRQAIRALPDDHTWREWPSSVNPGISKPMTPTTPPRPNGMRMLRTGRASAMIRIVLAASLAVTIGISPCRADGLRNCGPQFLGPITTGLESVGGEKNRAMFPPFLPGSFQPAAALNKSRCGW